MGRNPNTPQPLTTSQELRYRKFVDEYFTNGFNLKQAYIAVGYSPTSASKEALQLMKDPRVLMMMGERFREISGKYNITVDRIMEELSYIAFFDIADVLTDDGTLRPISEIPEQARRALAGLEINELFSYDPNEKCQIKIGDLKKLKVNSKKDALQLLGKELKMFIERVEHTASDDLAELIIDARRRAKSTGGPATSILEDLETVEFLT